MREDGIYNLSWPIRVMPFGLCNALVTFQRLMEKFLAGLTQKICIVYILVFSQLLKIIFPI